MSERPDAGRRELMDADDAFSAFRARIDRKSPVWWCFFSSGMLHVLVHFLRFVGDRSQIALISSELSGEEMDWVDKHVGLPCFHLEADVDPKSIYELLMRSADGPFGWIDVDCFLTAESWFDECEAALSSDVVLVGPFAYGPIPLLAAPFLLINPAAIAGVEERLGGPVSLGSYAFHPTSAGRHAPGVTSRVLQPYHLDAMSKVLCFEGSEMPFPQGGITDVLDSGEIVRSHERFHHRMMGRTVVETVFDAYSVLQLMAMATGFRSHRVRRYPGSKVISHEVVHAGSIGYWEQWIENVRPGAAPAGLASWSGHIDTLLLDDWVRSECALDDYTFKLEQRTRRLSANGISIDLMRAETADMFREVGVDVDAPGWDRLLTVQRSQA